MEAKTDPNKELVHKFIYNDDSEEVMYVAPNGYTKFFGVWEAFTHGWNLVRRGKQISLNGELI